ncbi:MAG TPA: hypothetical protein DCW86_03520 [Actinobacteria bacterium]|nr:hypothetical protein [Actinomycetota bacterium]
MRVLLIEPPFERLMDFYRDYFPIGLGYLATVLRDAGHQVKIYDAEHSPRAVYLSYTTRAERYDAFLKAIHDPEHGVWQEASDVVREFQPDLVGLSVMTVKYAAALRLAKLCKEFDENIYVVMGGPHPTIQPEKVLNDSPVDFVVRGEGEKALLELVESLGSDGDFTKVKGLSYKKNGEFIHNELSQVIQSLDDIPFPARELLHRVETYSSEDMGLMMTSRGCPFQCTYCSTRSMWGRRVRFRSVDNVVEEIKHIMSTYGVRQITFEDDSFTVDRERALELCDRMKSEGIDVSWSVITRIDLIDDELLAKMKRAGCNHVRIGVESGSERVLKGIKKGITPEQIRKGAELLRKHRLYWSAYFMIGLPMEEREDILASLRLMGEINPTYATLSVYTPYPGTELFDRVVKAGLASYDMDWSRVSHHSPHNYFTEKIPKKEFEEILSQVSREFDKHNGRLMALIAKANSKSRTYLNEPKKFLQDAKRFLYWSGILKFPSERS